MPNKPRIVILGGGVGAVTSAFHLSKDGWKQQFEEITLYQQGWRLGGKGASGRGPGERIEEHGLHIWFGFYENAFHMLRRCHEELDKMAKTGTPRWNTPFKTMADSFRRCDEISLTDYDGCGWKLWTADFFDEGDERPWDEHRDATRERSVVFYMARCLQLAADLACSLVRPSPGLEILAEPLVTPMGEGGFRGAAQTLRPWLAGNVQLVLADAAQTLDRLATEGAETPLVLDVLDLVLRGLDFATDFLRKRYDIVVHSSDTVRRAWYVVDLMIAIVRGVIEDGVVEEKSFDVVDDVDFRDWLLLHGADRDSADCALVRAIVYDLAFAYEGGDPQRPACGAGTALRGLLRTFFTYRGALMWKMNAGMGDVVFAPLYELLVKRGVHVRFFHRVEAVHASATRVEQIDIDVQATVPPGTEPADYLRAAAKSGVWPADPKALVKRPPGAAPVRPEVYESWYAGRDAAKVGTKVLRRGARTDGFDVVVFGLPVSTVRDVAPDLVQRSEKWKGAVDHIETVPTQAMQLWLDRTAAKLGAKNRAVVGGFVEPFDTWADMEHLVAAENVARSKTVAYFCNVMTDNPPPIRGQAGAWLAAQHELVRAQALRFLERDVGVLWPKAVDPLRGKFDWMLLVDPQDRHGDERLAAQYLRANVEPSERYVLSVPGSSEYRIRPDDTGFENLYAAGDWTACVLNAGCVEAAVMSGIRAANGIHRDHGDADQVEPLIGGYGP